MEPPEEKKAKLSIICSDVSAIAQEQATPMVEFDDLPTEIINMICQMSCIREKLVLRMVSKRLYSIISGLGKTVMISHADSKNDNYVQTVLKLSQQSVTTLSIMGYVGRISADSSCLCSCINITALDLYQSFIDEAGLTKLFLSLSNLKRLAISYDLLSFLTGSNIRAKPPALLALSSLIQLVIYEEHHFWLDAVYVVDHLCNTAMAMIGDSSKMMHNPDHNLEPYIFILSLYESYYHEYQTCLPIMKYDRQQTLFSIGQPLESNQYVHVSKVVSTSVLTKDHLYNHATLVMCKVPSSVPLNESNGSIINLLDFNGCESVSLTIIGRIVSCTPNLLSINVNNVFLTSPLEELYHVLSVHCKKIESVYSIVNGWHVCNGEKVWEYIHTMRCLEHLSVCSCFFLQNYDLFIIHGNQSYRIPMAEPINVRDFKPLSFLKSMILNSCTRNCTKYSLQDVLQVISDVAMTTLRCLHVYIPDSALTFVENFIVLTTLSNCRKLEELCIISTIPPVHQFYVFCRGFHLNMNLKHIVLARVRLEHLFIEELVHGQNYNLQFMELRLSELGFDDVYMILRGCPNLALCRVVVDIFPTRSYVAKCRELATFAMEECNLLKFSLLKVKPITGEICFIYHSILKKI